MQSTISEPVDTWGHILAASGIIVTVVLSLRLYVLTKRKDQKEISYHYYAVVVDSTEDHPFSGDLQVVFKGQPVNDATIVTVFLRNSGFASIRGEDFSRPLRITFPGLNVDVLAYELVGQRPKDLGVQIVASPVARNSVEIEPLLLNSGDNFSITVLTTGFQDEVSVSGRVTGIQKILHRPFQYQSPISTWVTLTGFLFTFVSGLGSGTYLDLNGHHKLSLVAMISCIIVGGFLTVTLGKRRSARY